MPKRKKRAEQIEFLKTLAGLSAEKQNSIIKFLNTESIDLLCECCHNLIFQDLGLTRAQKRKLKGKIIGKVKLLRFISKKSNKNSSRKKKFLQTGGALGAILSIAVPIIADLIMNAVRK